MPRKDSFRLTLPLRGQLHTTPDLSPGWSPALQITVDEEKALQPVDLAARASLQSRSGIRADLQNTIQK
jgi:hypothetical protein